MKTILITGGAGFIGKHLIHSYKGEEVKVISIDKNFSHVHANKNVFNIPVDMMNTDRLKGLFSDFNFDLVIHLAALTQIRDSSKTPQNYTNNNVIGMINLLEQMAEHNVKRFVNASCVSVYGRQMSFPSKEDATLRPCSLLGGTKIAGEMLASSYHEMYGISTISLRLANVYGNYMSDGLIKNLVERAEEERPITIFGQGQHQRDYVHVSDVVRAFRLSEKYLYKSTTSISQLFNIGTGKAISVEQVIERVKSYQPNKELTLNYVPKYLEDVEVSSCDPGYAFGFFGWMPEIKFEIGLGMLMSDYRQAKQKRESSHV